MHIIFRIVTYVFFETRPLGFLFAKNLERKPTDKNEVRNALILS